MRYFFKAKIEKEDKMNYIKLPFNIWEVCRPMEHIMGELIFDNKMIKCELLPEEKGDCKIVLTDEDIADIDVTKTHNILLHVGSTLIKVGQNSPYSIDKPIRKIDNVDIIIQPTDGTCGQTVVAMLAGVTIAEVCTEIGCREWQATMGRVISALNYYGIDHKDVIVYTEGEEVTLPECAVLMEKMGRYCHYLLYFKGKYYDPNLGVSDTYDIKKLQGYLEINLSED